MKWTTTSVIRYEMRDVIRVGGLVNTFDIKCVVIPGRGVGAASGLKDDYPTSKGQFVHPLFLWDYDHFFHHVAEAAEILGLKIITYPSGKWVQVMTTVGHPYEVHKALLKLITEEEIGREDYAALKNAVEEIGWFGGGITTEGAHNG